MRPPVFARLRALRKFERRHLPVLKTIDDLDLVLEIGFHQESGAPLTLRELLLMNLASVATVQRRLRRLRLLGVLERRRCDHDRRAVALALRPRWVGVFERYAKLLDTGARAAAPAGR